MKSTSGYAQRKKPKEGKALPPEFKGKVALEKDTWIPAVQAERKTYPQNWHSYNKAQTEEKLLFYKILNDAVNSLEIDEKIGQKGRPYHLMHDIIKACCVKVFCGFSSRRTVSELKLFQKLGYLKNVPSYNSMIDYFNNIDVEKYLNILYRMLALPLKQVEKKFAIDSTGFSANVKTDWVTFKFHPPEKVSYHTWKKLHVVTGVQTNIIVSASITEGEAGDSPQFESLVSDTGQNFKIEELSADPAYSSRNNVDLVYKLGGVPYILPKSNATGKSFGSMNWRKMILFWKEHKEEFSKHYHLRSNVESTFSMMKRKFSDHLRCRNEQSQKNEMLCKVVCHNISVLVNGIFELDLQLEWN